MRIVSSVSNVPIRLTTERYSHIARRHPEMVGEEGRLLETVTAPDCVLEGDGGTLMAVKHYAKTPLTEKHCVVAYRELGREDGFIVTAYFANAPASWRKTLWKR